MAYIRSKKIKRTKKRYSYFYRDDPDEYTYYQVVEGYRDESGKVKQRVLAHLGRDADPEAAMGRFERRAAGCQSSAADHLYAASHMRERSFENLTREEWRRKRFNRANYGRGKWLVPRAGTPVPDEPPYATGFAPKGWFYFPGETPEDAEREAAELSAKADEYATRAANIRSVVTKNVVPGAVS